MTHDEIIAVIAAHRDNKPLQLYTTGQWTDTVIELGRLIELIAGSWKFRVKPEPRRIYVPWEALGVARGLYMDRKYAERLNPNCEIVTFVEEEPK